MPHWRNEDGSWNHRAVVEDGIKIQNFDKMVQLAYEQGLNSGKDELIKETKNTNFSSDGGSNQPNRPTDRPTYEGGRGNKNKSLKVKFGGKK
jgi:hypothetical protein